MTESMLEKVARAGFAAWHGSLNPYDEFPELQAMWDRVARAAIEAMREPTFDPDTVSYHQGMTRADWWRAMVDEALK